MKLSNLRGYFVVILIFYSSYGNAFVGDLIDAVFSSPETCKDYSNILDEEYLEARKSFRGNPWADGTAPGPRPHSIREIDQNELGQTVFLYQMGAGKDYVVNRGGAIALPTYRGQDRPTSNYSFLLNYPEALTQPLEICNSKHGSNFMVWYSVAGIEFKISKRIDNPFDHKSRKIEYCQLEVSGFKDKCEIQNYFNSPICESVKVDKDTFYCNDTQLSFERIKDLLTR